MLRNSLMEILGLQYRNTSAASAKHDKINKHADAKDGPISELSCTHLSIAGADAAGRRLQQDLCHLDVPKQSCQVQGGALEQGLAVRLGEACRRSHKGAWQPGPRCPLARQGCSQQRRLLQLLLYEPDMHTTARRQRLFPCMPSLLLDCHDIF